MGREEFLSFSMVSRLRTSACAPAAPAEPPSRSALAVLFLCPFFGRPRLAVKAEAQQTAEEGRRGQDLIAADRGETVLHELVEEHHAYRVAIDDIIRLQIRPEEPLPVGPVERDEALERDAVVFPPPQSFPHEMVQRRPREPVARQSGKRPVPDRVEEGVHAGDPLGEDGVARRRGEEAHRRLAVLGRACDESILLHERFDIDLPEQDHVAVKIDPPVGVDDAGADVVGSLGDPAVSGKRPGGGPADDRRGSSRRALRRDMIASGGARSPGKDPNRAA